MALPLLGAMAVGGLVKGLGSLFGSHAANKQAKADAANATAQGRYTRDVSQKELDRRRKVLQGLLRFYSSSGLINEARRPTFGSMFGDLGEDVGADAYILPQAPAYQASRTSPWAALGGGFLGGATDVLMNSGSGRAPMGPTSPGQPVGGGAPVSYGYRGAGSWGYRPGSSSAALSDFEIE